MIRRAKFNETTENIAIIINILAFLPLCTIFKFYHINAEKSHNFFNSSCAIFSSFHCFLIFIKLIAAMGANKIKQLNPIEA